MYPVFLRGGRKGERWRGEAGARAYIGRADRRWEGMGIVVKVDRMQGTLRRAIGLRTHIDVVR